MPGFPLLPKRDVAGQDGRTQSKGRLHVTGLSVYLVGVTQAINPVQLGRDIINTKAAGTHRCAKSYELAFTD